MLKKFYSKICVVMLMIALICGFIPYWVNDTEEVQAASFPDYVIVLDAGHDATHAGAQSAGYHEEVLTYKIASYCKQELEKFPGVKVYMVRDSYACPNGGSSVTSRVCNSKRVEFSKNVKADLYISFHLNSAGSLARGVSVYYPNSNYKPNIGTQGGILAADILGRLKALGIKQNGRGTLIRNSEDNSRYPDGSLADYLAVIKGNKKNNIPAVLIEHCFISNASDRSNFLSSESKIKSLGVADANGIADYLGINSNSLRQYSDGNWYLYRNGKVDRSYNGLSYHAGNWWYVKNGKIDFSYESLELYRGTWIYIKNGMYQQKFNGIVQNNVGYWYVRNGNVDFNYSGTTQCNNSQTYNGKTYNYSGWYYFKKGKFISNKNTLVYINNNWWYVHNGKIDFSANTLVQNSVGWWYIKGGRVDFTYNGIARYGIGDWYVHNGLVDFKFNGLYMVSNLSQTLPSGEKIIFDGWYSFTSGKVDKAYTDVVYDGKEWKSESESTVNSTYTGLADNAGTTWFVQNGKIDSDYTGLVNDKNNNIWYIENGRVFTETDVKELNCKEYDLNTGSSNVVNGVYYISGGKVNKSFSGIAENKKALWYFNNGSVDKTVEKLIYHNNIWYYFVAGKCDKSFNGMAQNNIGYWYINDGQVDFSYSGTTPCYNSQNYNGKTYDYAGWYCFRKGKLNTSVDELQMINGSWWYVHNGVIDFKENTLVQNNVGWWYVHNGLVDFSFNGIAKNQSGDWYIKNGKVDFSANGLVQSIGKHQMYPDNVSGENITFDGWYYVEGGKVRYGKELLRQNCVGWWYVGKDGKVDFSKNTLMRNNVGLWYVHNGLVDFSYNGSYVYNGKTYTIKNGKAQ